MRLVWEEIAECGGCQISVIHTLCSHSRHRASIGSCYLCCSDCRAARTSKWPAMTGMKEWAEGRRAAKHNPEEGAHFCTNNNSVSTVASHASKWNKLSKTNETSFPKQMTHRKELRSLLEIAQGLFGMTQHWKQNHYRWLVDTVYITYILFSDDRWRWVA